MPFLHRRLVSIGRSEDVARAPCWHGEENSGFLMQSCARMYRRIRSGACSKLPPPRSPECGEMPQALCGPYRSVRGVDQQAVPSSQLLNFQPHAPLPAWLG